MRIVDCLMVHHGSVRLDVQKIGSAFLGASLVSLVFDL